MNPIMLDTSVCVRALRDRSGHLSSRFKARGSDLRISTVVLTELLFGAELSSRPEHHCGQVNELVSRMTVMEFDSVAASHAAEIRAHLQRAGTPIGVYDTLIAAHARSRGMVLVTGNLSDFNRVPGLRCEDWVEQ